MQTKLDLSEALLLSTAYAPPIEYMIRLYRTQGQVAYLEAQEHFVKQSYRSRCHITGPNGLQALTIPVEHKANPMIRDIRISDHGAWRHLHQGALMASYGRSPYFEYYWDDIRPFYEQGRYTYLWDFNWELLHCLSRLIDLELSLEPTQSFLPPEKQSSQDYRYRLSPKSIRQPEDISFDGYYQPFAERWGFVQALSIFDLIFNLGPESLLYLSKA